MSANVPTAEEFASLAARVADLEARLADTRTDSDPEFLTIPEAALRIGCGHGPCPGTTAKAADGKVVKTDCTGNNCRRCHGTRQIVNRQRVDDLLSSRRLTRVKDGGRTLIRTAELLAYLAKSNGRRNR